MGLLSTLVSSVVDVGKDIVKEAAPKIANEVKKRGIISKELTAIDNYAKRVAKAWVNQEATKASNKDAWNTEKSVVKDLGTIMKEEGDKLGKEMLLGLVPLLPTVEQE